MSTTPEEIRETLRGLVDHYVNQPYMAFTYYMHPDEYERFVQGGHAHLLSNFKPYPSWWEKPEVEVDAHALRPRIVGGSIFPSYGA